MILSWLVPEVEKLGLWSPPVRPARNFLTVVRPSTLKKTAPVPSGQDAWVYCLILTLSGLFANIQDI